MLALDFSDSFIFIVLHFARGLNTFYSCRWFHQ